MWPDVLFFELFLHTRHGKKTGTTLAGGNTAVDPAGKKASPRARSGL